LLKLPALVDSDASASKPLVAVSYSKCRDGFGDAISTKIRPPPDRPLAS